MLAYILVFFGGLVFLAVMVLFFIVNPMRTRSIRIHPRLHQWCRFYNGEIKIVGQIRGIDNDMIEVEYLDENAQHMRKIIHISNLYPAW